MKGNALVILYFMGLTGFDRMQVGTIENKFKITANVIETTDFTFEDAMALVEGRELKLAE